MLALPKHLIRLSREVRCRRIRGYAAALRCNCQLTLAAARCRSFAAMISSYGNKKRFGKLPNLFVCFER
jgi:hypothetical protein